MVRLVQQPLPQSEHMRAGHPKKDIKRIKDRELMAAAEKEENDIRGGICPCRQCRRQCKFFVSGVNFSIFTHFFVYLSLKLLKLGEIDGVKFLA